MFRFLKKHAPAVNAILRGVYFKDDPTDLDKGKYENRLTLLKVPRLTKERILRVSRDNLSNKGITKIINISAGAETLSELPKFNYLVNCLSLKITNINPSSTDDIQIHYHAYTKNIKEPIYLFHDYLNRERVGTAIHTANFIPTNEIQIGFTNNGSEEVNIEYTLFFSENTNEINSYESQLSNKSETVWVYRPSKLFNAVSIILTDTTNINAQFKLTVYFDQSNNKMELINETINIASTGYDNTFYFPANSNIELYIKNNKVSNLFYRSTLFFSKKLLLKTIADLYTGDGVGIDDDWSAKKSIALGFRPKQVIIYRDSAVESNEGALYILIDAGNTDVVLNIRSLTEGGGGMLRTTRARITDDGFDVSDDGGDKDPNKNGVVYKYMAIE